MIAKIHGHSVSLDFSWPGREGLDKSEIRAKIASALVAIQRAGGFPKGVNVSSQLIDRVASDLGQGFCGVCRQENKTCSFDIEGECAVHEVMSL